jgi:hypothetical protein
MQVLTVVVEGYLSEERLVKVLSPVDSQLARAPAGPYGVVVDILKMDGYSPQARANYITWHQRLSESIKGVAVVTHNKLWRMVIAAIGLTVPLRAFDTPEEGERWLLQIGGGRAARPTSPRNIPPQY